jgi:O-antigen/teichoic acid export membrane protein
MPTDRFRALIGRLVARNSAGATDHLAASFWSLVLRFGGMALSFVLGVVLARYLGAEQLGIYGIVIALALLLSVVAQAGLPALATREVSVALSRRDWPMLRAVVGGFATVMLMLSLLLAGALVLVGLVAPAILGSSPEPFILGAALIPLFSLTVLLSAEIRALGSVVGGQSLEIFIRPALTATFCLVVIAGSGSIGAFEAVGANVAASAIALCGGIFWLWRCLPHGARTAAPAPRSAAWTRSALPLALVDNLRQVDATYAMLLLGLLSANVEAGYFRVAYSTILVVVIPLSVLHVVLAPTLARASVERDGDKLARLLAISAMAMTASIVAALVLIVLVGQPLIALVFGEAYRQSWLPLTILTVAQLINAVFGVGWVLLSMGGGERQLTLSYAVSVPVSLAVAIPLIDNYGAPGAALAAVLGALIQNVIVWRAVRARFGLDCSLAGAAMHWRRP